MAYQFQAVDISAFDFHLALEPLGNPKLVNNDYQFLVDSAAYNQTYTKGAPIKGQKLKLRPLTSFTLDFHHFWHYYQTIWPLDVSYDFWKLQMPFIGKVSGQQINVDTGSPDFRATISHVLFINAFGWSTNFDISLRGNMTPDHVRDFVARLGSKRASMFELDKSRKSLPELFEYFGDAVQKEIYAPAVITHLRMNRHLLMTLTSFTGPVAPYRSTGNEIPRADRALFHSMLKGSKTIGLNEVGALEKEKKFLLTQFRDRPDFAISYFDYGTLIFMQEAALDAMAQGGVAGKAKCHSSNLRNYLLMTLTHYKFWKESQTAAGTSATIKSVRDDARATLMD